METFVFDCHHCGREVRTTHTLTRCANCNAIVHVDCGAIGVSIDADCKESEVIALMRRVAA